MAVFNSLSVSYLNCIYSLKKKSVYMGEIESHYSLLLSWIGSLNDVQIRRQLKEHNSEHGNFIFKADLKFLKDPGFWMTAAVFTMWDTR